MSNLIEQIKVKMKLQAKEFCKTWPQELYNSNDLELFYEKGFEAMLPLLEKAIEQRDTFIFAVCLNGQKLSWVEEFKSNHNQSLLELLEQK